MTNWTLKMTNLKNLNNQNTIELVINVIRNAVKKKKPLALARYGDGEALLIKQELNKPLEKMTIHVFQNIIGYNITQKEFVKYYNRWLQCAEHMDIHSFQTSIWHNNISTWFLREMHIKKCVKPKDICVPIAVTDKIFTHHLNKIVLPGDDLVLLTCRPTAKDAIEKETGASVRHVITLPSEKKYRAAFKENITVSQYPDIMNKIIQKDIPKHVKPGTIVLLGVGPTKPMYCKAIKDAGGIAIDIGSRLDFLAGYITRGKKKGTRM